MNQHNFRNSSLTPKNVFEVLNENQIKSKCGDEIFDLCLWLVSWINNETIRWRKDRKDSVPVSAVFLRQMCGQNSVKVIDILLQTGILIRTNEGSYFKHESREYCLADKFMVRKNNPLIPRFYRSNTFQRRISKKLNFELLKNKLNKKLSDNFLFKMVSQKTTFDAAGALQYINNTYLENSTEFKFRFELIEYFNKGFVWGHYANNCNRFYSTFTQLPSDLRKFIIIDYINTEKVYFDICNSQLQLFEYSILLKNTALFVNKDSENFFNLINDKEKDFYSEMINILGVNETRDSIKPLFSNLLYNINTKFIGWVKDNNIKDFYNKFKGHFPTIWNYIQKIKMNKKACSNFSILLMNIESDFILNKVAMRLYKMKISLVTIHDGFLVNKEHENLAQEIFIEESLKNFNKVLKFKKEIV